MATNTELCQLKPRELALYFRRQSKKTSSKTVATELLQSIEQEALPPTIFGIFLASADAHHHPLADALWQQHSRHVRHVAILRFGEAMRSANWEKAWDEVGATQGLLSLFTQISVFEVRELSRSIGCCKGKSGYYGEERKQRITELVRGLLPSAYPGSRYKSSDQRPLLYHYAQLVPACTSGFVEEILCQKSHPLLENLPTKFVVLYHFKSLRRLVLDTISRKDSFNPGAAEHILAKYLPPLCKSVPPTAGAEPGFSASMTFAVTVLQYLATQKDTHFPAELFLSELMEPLMRRLGSCKTDWNRIREVVELAIQYLEGNHRARAHISYAKGSLIFYLAIFWSQKAPVFEEQLVKLIHMESQLNQIKLTSYQPLLQSVKRPFRYRLLRMICLHGPDVGVDIDSIKGLKAIATVLWPINIFHILHRDDGVSLLKRLIQIHPDRDFLDLVSIDSGFSDANVLLTKLQHGTDDGETQAQAAIKALQAKAAKSREQTDRASFTQTALSHAIASGSLDLFSRVVLWMRRFQRDPKTVTTIYTSDVWSSRECVALLSGIPQDLKNRNASSVRSITTKANEIIMEILESAVMSLREPSFSAFDWTRPLALFREVIRCRMHQAGRLKRRLQLSEDDVYEALWADTATMLLKAEKMGLAQEHEALRFNQPHGPLAFSFLAEPVEPPLPSSFHFLDNLARSRDELWQVLRPRWDPAVAALNPPWPKGLPIQSLTGSYIVATDSAWKQTPFLADRATQIVMLGPAHALEEVDVDDETKKAIGEFVDAFDFALSIFVMQSPLSNGERESRVSAASLHAVNRLSRESMTEAELRSFWKAVFRRALPSVELPRFKDDITEDYPTIPTVPDPFEFTEWNPNPSFPKILSRKLVATALDCMLVASRYLQWDSRHRFQLPDPCIEAVSPPNVWSHERLANLRNIPPSVREGLVLTALLLQASDVEGASRFLATPFPSAGNLRYPTLFLDEEFLQAAENFRPSSVDVLSRFINIVPSTLLCSLAHSALELLSKTPPESTKIISMESTTYGILRLLSRSDRPQLATNLIIRIIVDRPSASSWHRHLLTKSLASNLASCVAKDLIESFASQVKEKLERQASQPRPEMEVDSSAASPKPLIKVTTVKFLAQFLDDANFVSPQFAVGVLIDLFQSATHIDIRVAVVDTILGKLARHADSDSDGLIEAIMEALKSIVPIIGSLNERHHDQLWAEAEKTGKLPEIYDDVSPNDPAPILGMVLHAVVSQRVNSRSTRQRLMESVLLPAIDFSTPENARWVRTFVRKHSPENPSMRPPFFPVKPAILGSLVYKRYSLGEVPEPILDLYHQVILTNLMPPSDLATLNRRVTKDADLRESNEGQHWLSLYGRGTETPDTVFPRVLVMPWSPSFDTDGTHLLHVQDLVVDQAMALLTLKEVSFSSWQTFMDVLAPPACTSTEEVQDIWLANAKPVVQRIIDNIESLRTPEWRRSKHRKPAMLPDTYDTQLWMLPYPHLNRTKYTSRGKASKEHKRCAPFGARVSLALCGPRGVSSLGLAHHGKLKSLEEAVLRCSPEDKLYLAWFLGLQAFNVEDEEDYLTEHGPVEEHLLRAELAHALLRNAELPPAQGEGEGPNTSEALGYRGRVSILDLLKTWKECEIEEIRMRGFQLCEQWDL